MKIGPGQLLDGRFLLRDPIGAGGMATIFQAEDLHDAGRLVAIKVPLSVFATGLGAWSMFQREEEIGRQLDHPYILKFLPLELDRRRTYLVTEYVPGRTLMDRLGENGPIPEREALAIASQLCEAIAHLHEKGFVHYDVKPANVIQCPDGGIRLIDLGLAHSAVTGRFQFVAAPVRASAECAAPEQSRRRGGRQSVDIYAVGALLYELLTGHTPFAGDDHFGVTSARLIGDPPAPTTLNPALSPQAEEIVLRALRRDPRERYTSAAQMKTELDHPERVVVSGLRNRLRAVTPWRRRLRWARHAALVGLLPVAVQVGLFVLLWWRFAAQKR